MKLIKLTKTDLKDCVKILKKAGAIHKKMAFPGSVWMHKDDYAELESNLKKQCKKQHKYASATSIDMTVGMELLNIGPCINLAKDMKRGTALVDVQEIIKNIQEHEDAVERANEVTQKIADEAIRDLRGLEEQLDVNPVVAKKCRKCGKKRK
jgi:hypothetical protein